MATHVIKAKPKTRRNKVLSAMARQLTEQAKELSSLVHDITEQKKVA